VTPTTFLFTRNIPHRWRRAGELLRDFGVVAGRVEMTFDDHISVSSMRDVEFTRVNLANGQVSHHNLEGPRWLGMRTRAYQVDPGELWFPKPYRDVMPESHHYLPVVMHDVCGCPCEATDAIQVIRDAVQSEDFTRAHDLAMKFWPGVSRFIVEVLRREHAWLKARM